VSTTPIWILWGWSRTFERDRFCIQVFIATPVSVACAVYGGFVWMLIAFFVGFWPFPYRARWTAEGLEVSWLFVRECLRVADIESARLRTGVRHLPFFRRRTALEIELAGGKRAVVVAPEDTLETFHSQITAALRVKQ